MAASGNRVLVVDDEPGLADLVAEYLQRIGELSVQTATNPEDGLALVRDDSKFDCVVSDYNMPEMNGLELLEAIREEQPTLPFILYTGRGSEEIASEAISAGVTDYLQKETGTDHYKVLANRIESAISENRAKSELRETQEKIEALHQTAARAATCTDRTELCELAVEAAEEILAFDICDISLCEGSQLVPRAVSKGVPSDGYYRSTPVDAEDNLAAEVFRTGDSVRINDVHEHGVAPAESDYRSALTIPIEDKGVFQAVSRELNGFSDRDQELAELLLAHVSAALDRLDSEEKLRDERDKFAALFHNIPHAIGVGTFDDETPIISEANPTFEEVFGWDIDHISGDAIDDLIVPETDAARHEAAKINDQIRSEEHVSGAEVRRLTDDGPRDFLLHTVRAPSEEADGFMIYTDITEQKRRERELQRQNAHLDDFVGVLSHDIRDSLEIADDTVRKLETTDTELLGTIQDTLRRIEDRVEEALDFAEMGRTVRKPTLVPLPSVIETAWETVETDDATLSVDDPPSNVAGDRERLRRLFQTLFRDAVERADANLTIEVGELDGQASGGLYIECDGVAVDSAGDALFDRQAETSDGSSLELHVVEDLARTHGWSVTSSNPEEADLRIEFSFGDTEA